MEITSMIAALEQALALSPDNAPLRLQLAALLMNAERLPDAEAHYKHVLAANPSDLKAKLGLANVFRRTDRPSAAIVVYDELYDRGVRDPELLLAYSRALVKDGSNGKAQEVYQELIAKAPGMADEELDGLFRVSGQEGQGDYDEDDDALDGLLIKPEEKFADVGGMDAVKKEIA